MLIEFNASHSEKFFEMTHDFYRSDAVLHTIPDENIRSTIEQLVNGSPYAHAYMIMRDNELAGYVLLALTYSNEAGGTVVWIEEIYVLPEFRGLGLAKSALHELTELYGTAARFRLEISPDNAAVRKLYENCGFKALDYSQMHIDR